MSKGSTDVLVAALKTVVDLPLKMNEAYDFQCDQEPCLLTFHSKGALWSHIAEEHFEFCPFWCILCGEGAGHVQEMIQHMAESHPNDECSFKTMLDADIMQKINQSVQNAIEMEKQKPLQRAPVPTVPLKAVPLSTNNSSGPKSPKNIKPVAVGVASIFNLPKKTPKALKQQKLSTSTTPKSPVTPSVVPSRSPQQENSINEMLETSGMSSTGGRTPRRASKKPINYNEAETAEVSSPGKHTKKRGAVDVVPEEMDTEHDPDANVELSGSEEEEGMDEEENEIEEEEDEDCAPLSTLTIKTTGDAGKKPVKKTAPGGKGKAKPKSGSGGRKPRAKNEDLEKHKIDVDMKDENTTAHCVKCNRKNVLNNPRSLRIHAQFHCDKEHYSCDLCPQKYPLKETETFLKHVKDKHNKEISPPAPLEPCEVQNRLVQMHEAAFPGQPLYDGPMELPPGIQYLGQKKK